MGIRRGLVLLLCFGVPRVALADEPSVDPGALRQDLATVIPQELENRHLPGAVVVVVDRQGVVFAAGYGVADLDSRRPVVPETTTFRVASVSKLLTATAVMQLVDRGRIELNRDVNAYLKNWRVPDTFPAPITARHLLTHTAGLSERFLDSRGRTREQTPGDSRKTCHAPSLPA
jgi:CubicO group peptidase (beta-lactamase class C family)